MANIPADMEVTTNEMAGWVKINLAPTPVSITTERTLLSAGEGSCGMLSVETKPAENIKLPASIQKQEFGPNAETSKPDSAGLMICIIQNACWSRALALTRPAVGTMVRSAMVGAGRKKLETVLAARWHKWLENRRTR